MSAARTTWGPNTRRRAAGLALAALAVLAVGCSALPALGALSEATATVTAGPSRTPPPTLTGIVSVNVFGTPATATPAPSETAPPPASTATTATANDATPTSAASTNSPDSAAIPATPCADQACVRANSHLWLERPIAAATEYVNYVDRSYPYGSTQSGQREPHHGVEFFNRTGTPVLAAAPGEVIVAGSDDSAVYGPNPRFYGNLVVVRLDDTYHGQLVYNLYGHLSRVDVQVGQRVAAGDLLGAVGATGVAIGAHLHFEVRVGQNDYASTRNPELWLLPLPYNGRPQGVIAGRVVGPDGELLPEVTVVIRPISTESEQPRNRFIQTYAGAPLINSDAWYGENFAIGDVPVGLYSVSVSTTRFYQQLVTVEPGQVSWVTFVVNPPLPTAPPTDTPEGGVPASTATVPAEASPPGEATPSGDVTPTPEGEAPPAAEATATETPASTAAP